MTTNTVTAYRMVQTLNVKLAEEGLPQLAPQYGYNELRKGRVTGVEGAGQTIEREAALEWIRKQLKARKEGKNTTGATVSELLQEL